MPAGALSIFPSQPGWLLFKIYIGRALSYRSIGEEYEKRKYLISSTKKQLGLLVEFSHLLQFPKY
jgi:hypothetical protein